MITEGITEEEIDFAIEALLEPFNLKKGEIEAGWNNKQIERRTGGILKDLEKECWRMLDYHLKKNRDWFEPLDSAREIRYFLQSHKIDDLPGSKALSDIYLLYNLDWNDYDAVEYFLTMVERIRSNMKQARLIELEWVTENYRSRENRKRKKASISGKKSGRERQTQKEERNQTICNQARIMLGSGKPQREICGILANRIGISSKQIRNILKKGKMYPFPK